MATQNMTLLSQDEIDILLSFLLHQKSSVSTNVLDQSSIDKLISIIKNNENNSRDLILQTNLANKLSDKLQSLVGLQLSCLINDTTNFIELFAFNTDTDEKIEITPMCLTTSTVADDNTAWGYSISPVIFDSIATCFKFKYTKATYDIVCELFALKTFGDINFKLPELYLPTNNLANILE